MAFHGFDGVRSSFLGSRPSKREAPCSFRSIRPQHPNMAVRLHRQDNAATTSNLIELPSLPRSDLRVRFNRARKSSASPKCTDPRRPGRQPLYVYKCVLVWFGLVWFGWAWLGFLFLFFSFWGHDSTYRLLYPARFSNLPSPVPVRWADFIGRGRQRPASLTARKNNNNNNKRK